jgi:threonyl-tRNA synthetase
MLKRFDLANRVQNGAGLEKQDFEFSIRTVSDFLKKDRAHVLKIVKKWGKPVLIEAWDKRFFYFVLKLEWNFVDALDKAACLATDQIDIENAKRYGIYFTDKDNKKKLPLILHLSPSGSLERMMYALLEKAYMQEKTKKNPTLPMWLSPTQVRLCPVNEGFIKYCETIADRIEKQGVRVDIDNRTESVGKKIRDSETEWVPLTVVVGDKEKKSGKLAVRFRESGKIKPLSADGISRHIKKETDGKPFRPLPLPRLLTKRPGFVA